jgi:hypothetical protein
MPQCTLQHNKKKKKKEKRKKVQEGKTGPCLGGENQWERGSIRNGEEGQIWWTYFVFVYKNWLKVLY